MSLTVQKKLRSGVPVWMDYPRRTPVTRQLERDLRKGSQNRGSERGQQVVQMNRPFLRPALV
jgi:hypothetical protein